MKQRLLVLGAGWHQLKLIRRAEERGIEVVVSDYYPDSPGKRVATFPTDVNAIDVSANLELARKHAVSGVITSGSDMTALAMADIADALGFPCYLSPKTARLALDKRQMKRAFAEHGLPQAKYLEVDATSDISRCADLRFPVVVKPSDSQGQRGTAKVDTFEGLATAIPLALAESRSKTALVEEFMTGHEIATSAWVIDGVPHLLSVTDRVTYNPLPAIGICFRHVFPSKAARGLTAEIRKILNGFVRAYGLSNGPMYGQMIVTTDGRLFVIEEACRTGGGHEPSWIPLVTGVDQIDLLIDSALGQPSKSMNFVYDEEVPAHHAMAQFLLPRPGRVAACDGFPELLERGIIEEGSYYCKPGHTCKPVETGPTRIGYFIAKDRSRELLLKRARDAYDSLALRDESGRNLLFWPDESLILG